MRVRGRVRAGVVGSVLCIMFAAVLPLWGQGPAELVADLQTTAGEGSSNPGDYQVVGTTLFFIAEDDLSGRELWRFDAGSSGATRVTDIVPGPGDSVDDIVAFGSGLLMRADNDIWFTDGTAIGTELLLDIPPNLSVTGDLVVAGSFGYFVGDSLAFGPELFVTDGTAAGTQFLLDGFPGRRDPTRPGSSISVACCCSRRGLKG